MPNLGLAAGLVDLSGYQPAWSDIFEQERSRLPAVACDHLLDVQHIDSTFVPGLITKPILDIGAAVASFEAGAVCVEPIVGLGYAYRVENRIPRRHYFLKGEPRTHHLHVVEVTSRDWRINLLFRDYLLEHADVAAGYARLKRDLAQRFRNDRPGYQRGKDGFIQRVLENATAESAATTQ